MDTNDIQESFKLNDHDLLIKVFVIQQEMYKDVKELKDGTTIRLSALERDKADRELVLNNVARISVLELSAAEELKELKSVSSAVTDLDSRLVKIERYIWIGVGIIAAVHVALGFIIKSH